MKDKWTGGELVVVLLISAASLLYTVFLLLKSASTIGIIIYGAIGIVGVVYSVQQFKNHAFRKATVTEKHLNQIVIRSIVVFLGSSLAMYYIFLLIANYAINWSQNQKILVILIPALVWVSVNFYCMSAIQTRYQTVCPCGQCRKQRRLSQQKKYGP